MLLSIRTPAGNERGPQYMEQALAAIHQAKGSLTLLLACHADRVGLFVEVPQALAALVKSQLHAQYPECTIEPIPEASLATPHGTASWQAEIRLSPDIFPLKRHPQYDDLANKQLADPLSALLTALAPTRKRPLQPRIEIRLKPASRRRRSQAQRAVFRLSNPFFRTHHRLAHLYARWATSPHILARLAGTVLGRLGGRQSAMHAEALTTTTRLHDREEYLQAAADKLARPLFATHLSIVVSGPQDREGDGLSLLREIVATFGVFHSPGLGRFHVHRLRRCRSRPARPRGRPVLLSAEELSTIFHPATLSVKAPTMTTVESREMEPPVDLPVPAGNPDLAVVGTTLFRGQKRTFGLLPEDRLRHMMLLGKTGQGKTSLMENLIVSDLRASRGLCVLDPHGDLADALVAAIPSHRTNEAVIFEASDTSYPLAFNVLQCRSASDRPLVASAVLSTFRKLWRESWGPRLEYVLRHALLALLETPGASLLALPRLLTDARYRKTIVARLNDPATREFWQQEFTAMPPRLQAEWISPVLNKAGAFVSSPILRNILGQSRSTIDIRQIMDEGRILIANVAKGRIGHDASGLLGSFLVTAIHLAAMSRADIAEAKRRPFFLYVDECSNFASDSFAEALSEGRKYGLALTCATQFLAQLDELTLAGMLGNVGSMVAFQLGAQDAELLADQLAGEVQKEDLLRLPRYQAYVRLLIGGQPSRPFSMRTIAPVRKPPDPTRPAKVRSYSRQRYGRPVARVEEEIRRAFAGV